MRFCLFVSCVVAAVLAQPALAPEPQIIDHDWGRHLERQLRDRDPRVRERAAKQLGDIGSLKHRVVDSLGLALYDRDPAVRLQAATSLAGFGSALYDLVPHLVAALEDKNKDMRIAAVNALSAAYGGKPRKAQTEAAIKAVIEALKDDDVRLRFHAAGALGSIGPQSKDVIPALVEALKDKHVPKDERDIDVRFQAASALGAFGSDGKAAVPALLEALRSPDRMLRSQAAQSITKIAPDDKKVLTTLGELLKSKDPHYRAVGATYLGVIGPSAKEYVPDIIALFDVRDVEDPFLIDGIRESVVEALGRIGPEARTGVPTLIKALKDKGMHPTVRRKAAGAIGRMGIAAKSTIPDLIQVLSDRGNNSYHQEVISALKGIGPDAVLSLIELLKNDETYARRMAAYALGEFGPSAKSALKSLKLMRNDADAQVREEVADAMTKIEAQKLESTGK